MKNSQVKICGITMLDDAEYAIDAGANYLGFIFYERSKRYISYNNSYKIINLVKNKIATVAVTVDPSDEDIFEINELNVSHIQLHGSESLDRVIKIKTLTNCKIIKAFGLENKSDLKETIKYESMIDAYLFDAKPSVNDVPGGNAKRFDWKLLNEFSLNSNYFLSGGLNIDNIETALKSVKTNFFDLSSGVESSPGIKDKHKITQFINTIKKYDN